jgi:hypothetical protein
MTDRSARMTFRSAPADRLSSRSANPRESLMTDRSGKVGSVAIPDDTSERRFPLMTFGSGGKAPLRLPLQLVNERPRARPLSSPLMAVARRRRFLNDVWERPAREFGARPLARAKSGNLG